MKKAMALLLGLVFGLALSLSRVAQFDKIFDFFALRDFTVPLVMLSAMLTGLGFMYLITKHKARDFEGKPIKVETSPFTWRNALGGAIFGIGWGMSGSCPGTALAQLGEGHLLALFTLAGLVAGTFLYALLIEKFPIFKKPEEAKKAAAGKAASK